jgi:hypothetical protein
LSDGFVVTVTVGQGKIRVEQGQHSPGFGIVQPAPVIAIELIAGRSLVTIEWQED